MTTQIPLPLPHSSSMGADDFLVTSSNRDAIAWVNRWPEWPAHGLIISGASGSGKTHLLAVWLHKTSGRSLVATDLSAFDIARLSDLGSCVAIDDADLTASDRRAEENFFHIYNHVKSIGGSLLLTMSTGAGQASFLLPDLRSRLLTLPSVALGPPDDALLHALLVKQFRDRHILLDAGVATYVISRVPRDAATITAIVEKLDQASLSASRKITVALARQVLEEHDGRK